MEGFAWASQLVIYSFIPWAATYWADAMPRAGQTGNTADCFLSSWSRRKGQTWNEADRVLPGWEELS